MNEASGRKGRQVNFGPVGAIGVGQMATIGWQGPEVSSEQTSRFLRLPVFFPPAVSIRKMPSQIGSASSIDSRSQARRSSWNHDRMHFFSLVCLACTGFR